MPKRRKKQNTKIRDIEQLVKAASTRRYPAYPRYKPSGVEWLGDVPQHWVVKRLKRITTITYGESHSNEDCKEGNSPVYGSNGIVGYNDTSNSQGNTIIIGRKGSFGKVKYSNVSCFAIDTTYYIDKRNTNSNLRWLYYLLYSLRLDSYSQDSAVPGLSREDAYSELVVHPSKKEQKAIAKFLDNQTRKIDDLIEAKRELLEILKEKRQALITRCVTKGLPAGAEEKAGLSPEDARKAGLSPNRKFKPSGIDWIGVIPEHWEVKRLKYLTYLINEKKEVCEENKYPYLGLENVESWKGNIVNLNNNFGPTGISNVFKSKDILFGKLRPYLAKACAVNFDGICSSELMVLRTRNMNRHFLLYTLLSDFFIKIVNSSTYGAKMPRANWEFIGNMKILVPPQKEQKAIANYLDKQTQKIDDISKEVNEAIKRLSEYRTALISAAVTGKIDVRQEVS